VAVAAPIRRPSLHVVTFSFGGSGQSRPGRDVGSAPQEVLLHETAPNAMIVRKAEPNDAEGICRVQSAAIRQLCASHYSPAEIEAWAGPPEPNWYRSAIGGRELFVAVEGDTIIGFGQLNLDTAEIDAIYVHPAAARRGVGSALLRRLEEVARQHDLASLHLAASLNSVPFYESSGFRRQRHTKFPILPAVEIASLVMEKALEPCLAEHPVSRGSPSPPTAKRVFQQPARSNDGPRRARAEGESGQPRTPDSEVESLAVTYFTHEE
jgi:putative acetyltransferase